MTFSYWLQGAKIQTFFLLMKKLGKKSPKTEECNLGPGPRVKFSGQTLYISKVHYFEIKFIRHLSLFSLIY